MPIDVEVALVTRFHGEGKSVTIPDKAAKFEKHGGFRFEHDTLRAFAPVRVTFDGDPHDDDQVFALVDAVAREQLGETPWRVKQSGYSPAWPAGHVPTPLGWDFDPDPPHTLPARGYLIHRWNPESSEFEEHSQSFRLGKEPSDPSLLYQFWAVAYEV